MPRTPWMVGRKVSTLSPRRRAQAAQARSAASIELMIVPSMSNRKAANTRFDSALMAITTRLASFACQIKPSVRQLGSSVALINPRAFAPRGLAGKSLMRICLRRSSGRSGQRRLLAAFDECASALQTDDRHAYETVLVCFQVGAAFFGVIRALEDHFLGAIIAPAAISKHTHATDQCMP